MIPPDRLRSAYLTARDALLAERVPEGHWVGELSTSALSTATAVMALHLVNPIEHRGLIDGGLKWLADHQNADGGWGDTVKSVSNISTTMLCRAALALTGAIAAHPICVENVEAYITRVAGKSPEQRAEAIRARYGKDRTFSVPILMASALAGEVPWREVPRLPFELACLPQSWYRFARLPVVSYALPALIAIGQCVHHHRTSWNPIRNVVRWAARRRTLKVLRRIQPTTGGYLEATPLTSFVVMALASSRASGDAARRVIAEGVRFIVNSVRPDGSWPIDTDLSIWVTTLSLNALAATGKPWKDVNGLTMGRWLLAQQTNKPHPYTGAAPFAWGWSTEAGSVPDCDDTPGAVLAFFSVGYFGGHTYPIRAVRWMLGLQNRDGGWPTFCRGWGALPFDRSGADLTAHVLRALAKIAMNQRLAEADEDVEDDEPDDPSPAPRKPPTHWTGKLEEHVGALCLWGGLKWKSYDRVVKRGLAYLAREQRPDGSWLPLWFGNQHAPDDINPVYGTARVLAAYRDLGLEKSSECQRGVTFLLGVQNADGGWGGASGCPSSVEETALAVEVLLTLSPGEAVQRGVAWLVEAVESGRFRDASPIGFYFAKLWYFEKLYPLIFTVAALGVASRLDRGENL